MLVVVITDARHEPARLDQQMTEWLESKGKTFIVVATKSDKLSANKLKANLASLSGAFSGSTVIPYSSLTRLGRDQVWRKIISAADIQRG